MTWWGWIPLGLYIACALVAVRKIAWVVASDMAYRNHIAGDDVVFGLFIGTLACGLWPLLWIGYSLHHREGETPWGNLLSPPRRVRRTEEMAARDQRILELEREVGLHA